MTRLEKALSDLNSFAEGLEKETAKMLIVSGTTGTLGAGALIIGIAAAVPPLVPIGAVLLVICGLYIIATIVGAATSGTTRKLVSDIQNAV